MEISVLISNCIKQDRKAQKEFYLLFADRLMNVSLRYCSDIPSAKDVLQNAFVKIFTHLDQFDESRGNIDNWTVKVVINEALQYLRKQKKLSFDLLENQAIYEETQLPDALSSMRAVDLMKIIDLLPDGFKYVFYMYEIEGFKHKDIAQQLNITESTSRSQLTRAKKMIREYIDRQKSIELC